MNLVTPAAASEFLNVRVQRVYELVRQHSIPYIKLGSRQLRFDLDELAEWARRGGANASRTSHSVNPNEKQRSKSVIE